MKEMLSAWCGNAVQFLRILLSSSQRKHAYRWLCSLRRNYLLDTKTPWMTFDAVDYLVSRLSPKAKVFEYGGDGSTYFTLRQYVFLDENERGSSFAYV